ncbi:penicillin-insensitive murein endopeptidase [Methylobacterium brachythecii]|uniref:Penicillin-insensitive murein endopeptidase n=1 Tax=Methylobacterium brachythecii TaxID=1176177 RepID=A0A7W6F5K4_9HYPH|nr:penicillin-insensitive murein endopeptidase [Methylobacterium brachythecii]MBB3900981.1 penicillin-insensitive murein endopeptidase [Methylobacterium brachythecii]GLS45281.1 penicillin-insensitive murein endopeptidase [Methylobacterium brachythecii]
MLLTARLPAALALTLAILAGPAQAQDKGTLDPKPLPPLANPNDPSTPAKALFGRVTVPSSGASHIYGSYAKGCFAGGEGLPFDGPTWQVMRPSRNRRWGTPYLINFMERLANTAPQVGWPGLLVGDMAQPRGGPMLTGHASHQIGIDADVWLTPMPDRTLTRAEREQTSATDMVRGDRLDIDPDVWTSAHLALIRLTAKQPEVARIFVNAAIKKALCRSAGGDRGWLTKVRPMYGHNYHYHIRLACPRGSETCEDQAPPPGGDGCGSELDYWFSNAVLHPQKPKNPPRPKPPMTMAALPAACQAVLHAR